MLIKLIRKNGSTVRDSWLRIAVVKSDSKLFKTFRVKKRNFFFCFRVRVAVSLLSLIANVFVVMHYLNESSDIYRAH